MRVLDAYLQGADPFEKSIMNRHEPPWQLRRRAETMPTGSIPWADTERGRGPTGTAIRTGKPSVVRNMLTDPNVAPWREDALKRGYASAASLPLRVDQETIGVLNIRAAEPDAFDEEELNL